MKPNPVPAHLGRALSLLAPLWLCATAAAMQQTPAQPSDTTGLERVTASTERRIESDPARGTEVVPSPPSSSAGSGPPPSLPDVEGMPVEPFSLYLAEADIRDVLHMLGRHFRLNIVMTPEVQGNVSVYFTGVDPQQALRSIVGANGFAHRSVGDVIEVYRPAGPDPASNGAESGPVMRMLVLDHADAAEMLETLRGLLPEDASTTLQVDARRNALVAKGPASEVESVIELAGDLDHPVPQIRIEVQILETLLSDTERFGVDWFARVVATGARRPHTFPFDNSVLGGDFWPKNQTAGDNLTFSTVTGTTTSQTLALFPEDSAFPFTSVEDFVFGYLDASQFRAALEVIDTETDTRLVSKPEITTLNNREAVITIGNTVPIPTYSRNDQTSVTNISGYETEYIGTTLSVVPRVVVEDRIAMRIRPEISDILEFRGEGAFQLPVTATRSADTTVVLEDGKTLVIGGLVREREVERDSKIPFLGDVPGLKYFFSYKGKELEKSDLLIFITPHIMDEERMQHTGQIEFEGKWLTDAQVTELSSLRSGAMSLRTEVRSAVVARAFSIPDPDVRELFDPSRVLSRMLLEDASREIRTQAARVLAAGDPDAFLETISDLAATKDPETVPVLVDAALSLSADHLRLAAVEASASVDRHATIEWLNRLGTNRDAETAERASLGLWVLGNGSETPIVLFHGEANDDPWLRGAALRCLSTQGPTGEIPEFVGEPLASDYDGAMRAWLSDREEGTRARASVTRLLAHARHEDRRVAWVASPYETKKLDRAMAVLEERSPAFAHLVHAFLPEVRIGDGPTRVDEEGVLHLWRWDLEEWPEFALSHQLVRYAASEFFRAMQRDLCELDHEVLTYRTQYWAVHEMLAMETEHRGDYDGFLRSVVAVAGDTSGTAGSRVGRSAR